MLRPESARGQVRPLTISLSVPCGRRYSYVSVRVGGTETRIRSVKGRDRDVYQISEGELSEVGLFRDDPGEGNLG